MILNGCNKKRKQGSAPTSRQVAFYGIGDVIEEEDPLQHVDNCQYNIQYTTMLIIEKSFIYDS